MLPPANTSILKIPELSLPGRILPYSFTTKSKTIPNTSLPYLFYLFKVHEHQMAPNLSDEIECSALLRSHIPPNPAKYH